MTANMITVCRIICSCMLICFPLKSIAFLALYLLCGISDAVDGSVARKMHSESRTGEILDSVSDLVFVVAAACKILPRADFPAGLWAWILSIALIKITAITAGSIRRKQFCMPHTVANKITGFLLFPAGIRLCYSNGLLPVITVCAVASFAAVQELSLSLK